MLIVDVTVLLIVKTSVATESQPAARSGIKCIGAACVIISAVPVIR